jgi:hypothetical protein
MRVGPVASLTAPLLLLQMRPRIGVGASELRPMDQLLFDAASQPKELWLIPGAAHVDYLEFAGDDYRRRISTLFERTVGGVAATGN